MTRLLLATMLAWVAAWSHAAVYTVTSNADNGAGTLREAVALANANPGADTINFAVTGTITLTSGHLLISSGPLTIAGPGASNLTIDGGQTTRILWMNDNTTIVTCPDSTPPPDYLVTVSGLTLQNGNRKVTDSQGGAIFSTKSLVLDSLVIRDNVARAGGGVAFSPRLPGQSLAITNTQFSNNAALPTVAGNTLSYSGGALLVADYCFGTLLPATVTIAQTTFSGNRAQPDVRDAFGGAIALYNNSTVTMSRVRVTGNGIDRPVPPVAGFAYTGGGIYANTKSITIVDSEISDNYALNSGGLAINGSQSTLQTPADTNHASIVNSTVSGNLAAATGGAMILFANVATEIYNSTIADNFAGGSTGTSGVHLSKPSTGTYLNPTLALFSTILGQARGGTSDLSANVNVLPSTTVNATNSLVQFVCPTCAITVTGASNLLGSAPLLGPLVFNGGSTRTMAMLAGSPVADAGSNPLSLTHDQRGPGFPRSVGAGTDIGAQEGAGTCAGFTDVSSTNAFCPNVEWMRNRAITLGCSSTSLYCPNDPVIRLSMAAFMSRLGVALTPRKLYVEASPGALIVAPIADPLPTLVCMTADVPLATYRRAAIVNTTLSGLADANPVSWRGTLHYSTDSGATWQATPTQTATRSSSSGNQWSNTALGTVFSMLPGFPYRFAMGVRRDNLIPGTTGNFTQSTCQLDAVVVNVNGTSSPFDSPTALDGTRW